MMPNKVDITMSMIEREALNVANLIADKFGYQNHPVLRIALEYGKRAYGDKIRAVVASIVESDETMEAGSMEIKESMNNYVDDFQKRLKKRLEEQKDAS